MKRVLFLNITDGVGSTGAIIDAVRSVLRDAGWESALIHGRGQSLVEGSFCFTSATYCRYQRVLAAISGIPYEGCGSSTKRIINFIREWKPDLVNIHCCNGHFVNLPKLFGFLKGLHIPVVLTNHAEFYYTGSCSYAFECAQWKKGGCIRCPRFHKAPESFFFDRTRRNFAIMKQALSDWESLSLISVSPWVKSRIGESVILKNYPNTVILNGVDCSAFRVNEPTALKEKGIHVGVFVPRLTPNIKGGQFVETIAEKCPSITFEVFGLRKNKGMPRTNMVGHPVIHGAKDLAAVYSGLDAVLLLSQGETFSMVCAEALCCGTPIIGFECGGPESVFRSNWARFVPYGDIEGVSSLLGSLKRPAFEERIAASKWASDRFDQKRMANDYLVLFQHLLG